MIATKICVSYSRANQTSNTCFAKSVLPTLTSEQIVRLPRLRIAEVKISPAPLLVVGKYEWIPEIDLVRCCRFFRWPDYRIPYPGRLSCS